MAVYNFNQMDAEEAAKVAFQKTSEDLMKGRQFTRHGLKQVHGKTLTQEDLRVLSYEHHRRYQGNEYSHKVDKLIGNLIPIIWDKKPAHRDHEFHFVCSAVITIIDPGVRVGGIVNEKWENLMTSEYFRSIEYHEDEFSIVSSQSELFKVLAFKLSEIWNGKRKVKKRTSPIQRQVSRHSQKFIKIDRRFTKIERKLSNLESSLIEAIRRLDAIENTIKTESADPDRV